MGIFFLMIIYMAFISLGLPDSLLGSAWSVMRLDIGAPLGAAGIISMTVTGGTILSSLFSHRVIKRFGTGKVTAFSVLLTALSLLAVSITNSFVFVILLAIPLGIGAGSVDAGLNNYVAVHYKPHHMSWLHCFWGVGATLGPIIMAQNLMNEGNWRGGYRIIGLIQAVLVLLLFITLPLWKKMNQREEQLTTGMEETHISKTVLSKKAIKYALISFLLYCGAELSVGLWGSSFLVQTRGMNPAMAARWISMYYAGITIGRFIVGFLTMKVSCRRLIQLGLVLSLVGILSLFLPLGVNFSLVSLILIGLGFAPVFPCMVHETPIRFGKEQSQRVIGLQMAFAYIGSTVLPPFFGLVISIMGDISLLPAFLLIYTALTLLATEIIAGKMRKIQS